MIGRRGEWAPVCRLRLDRAEKVKKTWFSRFISVTILEVQNASLCVLVCWWSGPCDESQYNAIAQLSELPRTHTKLYDVSGHNFLTVSSHRRTTVSSSAPPLATPFPKCKSLNPKVIYPVHVSNLWATCVCFKVCRMYFCNIISYLCN